MSAKADPQKNTLTVRTAQNPTEEVEVTVKEYIDLNRQGLIFDGTKAEAKAAVEPVVSLDTADPYSPTPEAGTDKKKEA